MTAIALEVRRPGRAPARYPVEPDVYLIGRDDDCKVHLVHSAIGPRHAILTIRDDSFWIDDLGAGSGTFVDGERVTGRQRVRYGEEVRIGPFTLVLVPDETATATPEAAETIGPAKPQAAPAPAESRAPEPPAPAPAAAPVPPVAPADSVPAPVPAPVHAQPHAAQAGFAPAVPAELQVRRSIKQQIHRELVTRLDIKRLSASRIGRDELRERAMQTIRQIVEEVSARLPPGVTPADLSREICDEALGLGPLEDYLADETITEVMVNGPNQVYVEKSGKLIRTERVFMDEASVLAIIERIVSPIGRRIDESQPYVDARLPDGSRVNAIIPPLSLIGPCLTIRKFAKTPFADTDLIRFGTMTPFMAEFCKLCVVMRKNIVVSGGTGSGKTTLLNVLSSYLPVTDRIVTIEDAAELRLNQAHVVRLEARPPNIEGRGAITIRDLVRNALRMRPDRIVVGECRGGEALDMLQAMNTGHDGSLTTVHANSPRDVISRLETMVLMSGMDLPVRAIREQIASAIDVIVHESRFSDGTRKIVKITEVVGQEGEQITMQDIFEYVQTGVDGNARVVGKYRSTGAVPTFLEQAQARGIAVNRAMFDPQQWKD
jgi:pilus assembly protein CpaF